MRRALSLLILVVLAVGLVVGLRTDRGVHLIDRITGDTGRIEYFDDGQLPPATGTRGLIVLPDDGADAILGELKAATESIDLYV